MPAWARQSWEARKFSLIHMDELSSMVAAFEVQTVRLARPPGCAVKRPRSCSPEPPLDSCDPVDREIENRLLEGLVLDLLELLAGLMKLMRGH